MKIWIDADSCPKQVRDIVVRASQREKIEAVFVANRDIPILKSPYAKMIIVPQNDGEADSFITNNMEPMDIVITRDIFLAEVLIRNNAVVLNDRGDLYNRNNIRERLSIGNVMKEFRMSGILKDLGKNYSKREAAKFANAFDRELTKRLKIKK